MSSGRERSYKNIGKYQLAGVIYQEANLANMFLRRCPIEHVQNGGGQKVERLPGLRPIVDALCHQHEQ